MKTVHFYWLDSIRFIAAFMVLLSHSRNTFFPAFADLPAEQHNVLSMVFTMFCRMGHEAVIIFFVLSGFLVGGRGFERIRLKTMDIGGYVIDRLSRIYPPLVMAILFYFVTSIFIPGTPFSYVTAIGNLLNLQGICCNSLVSPFWSLSYEVWFYIVFGLLSVALLGKNNKMKFVSFTMFVASSSVFALGLNIHYLFIWMMGAVAYIVRPLNKNKMVLISSLFGFFLFCMLWQFSKNTRSLEMNINWINKDFIELGMSLMTCLFIQQVILFKPKNRVTFRIEKYLGKMATFSYTLYLSHRIVFLWIIAFIFPKGTCDFTIIGILKYIIINLITLLFCWFLYLISEKHSPKIKSFLKDMYL